MLLCDLEGLVNALTDRHRRDNDDKLRETVTSMQLKDCLGIDIGFACAGFHLNGKLHRISTICQRQQIPLLYQVHVLGNRSRINPQRISNAKVMEQADRSPIFHGECAVCLLLPNKQIHDGVHRIGLEVLVFEFKLHFLYLLLLPHESHPHYVWK